MRIVYAADLHGDPSHYEALRRLCRDESAGALLLGGDLFPSTRQAAVQVSFARHQFAAFVAGVAAPVYAIAGNEDWPAAISAASELPGLRWLSLAPANLGELGVVGYPYVTPTPFRRRDYDRRDLRDDQGALPPGAYLTGEDGVPHPAPSDYLQRLPSIEEDLVHLPEGAGIWVMHGPPHGGALDVIGSGRHVGSKALRARIEALKPLLTLHGHIHESPSVTGRWAELIGRTVCVNPGRGEPLHAVVLDTGAPLQTLRHTVYGPFRKGAAYGEYLGRNGHGQGVPVLRP